MKGQPTGLRPELVAMIAVIAISSWHVGNYMSQIDGWLMASIMGAVLGYCNFIMAHNIFKPQSTSRFPSFVGLVFFAVTSTWLQYTYFNNSLKMTSTYLLGINLDALFMGIWAPAAEVLLGWVHAANSAVTLPTPSVSHSVEHSQSVTNNGLTGLHITAMSVSPHKLENHNGQGVKELEVHERFENEDVKYNVIPADHERHNVDSEDGSVVQKIKLTKAARHTAMRNWLRVIQDETAIPVQEWAVELGVSRQTVYRDIEEVKKRMQFEIAVDGEGRTDQQS